MPDLIRDLPSLEKSNGAQLKAELPKPASTQT